MRAQVEALDLPQAVADLNQYKRISFPEKFNKVFQEFSVLWLKTLVKLKFFSNFSSGTCSIIFPTIDWVQDEI